MPGGPDPGIRGGRAPCARFASWCCGWSERIPGVSPGARRA